MYQDTTEKQIVHHNKNQLTRTGKMSEWISVKDRLPDYDTIVLWCDESGVVFTAEIDHDSDWEHFQEINRNPFDWSIIPITHWMPLPEPPSE